MHTQLLLFDPEVLTSKLADAMTPGFIAEFDPAEAEAAGAFEEHALSEADALEEVSLRFIQRTVQGAPVVADSTGGSVGSRPGCKVGDQVLRFSDESIYAGAALVVEVKHDASYSVSKALAELDVARSNRGAQVGLFVMARSHAPSGFPEMARYGNDILVTWDAEDESTDPYLHAGVILGLALASRQRRPADEGDIKALADIEHRIQQERARHEKMKKLAERIRKDAEDLGDELRKGGDKLTLLLRNAKETLKALNVELEDHTQERSAPVLLPANSLTDARAELTALPAEGVMLDARESA